MVIFWTWINSLTKIFFTFTGYLAVNVGVWEWWAERPLLALWNSYPNDKCTCFVTGWEDWLATCNLSMLRMSRLTQNLKTRDPWSSFRVFAMGRGWWSCINVKIVSSFNELLENQLHNNNEKRGFYLKFRNYDPWVNG